MFIKKIILPFIMLLVMSVSVCAEDYSVSPELSSYGEKIYSEARSYFGRSFNGYCGTYVKCQLRAMGIFDGKFDFHGNGNQWYSNFENVETTSGGYYVYRESGRDCFDKLTQKYGDNLKNIVVSFPIQAGYSARYPGAGHAFIIYEISDGIAYYSESFSFGKHREGQVIAEEIDSLIERYERRHGNLTGCVMLSKLDMDTELSMEENALIISELKETIEDFSDIDFIAIELKGISQSHVTA